MEALGAASSIFAVIELSASVTSLCFKYYKAVKNAKPDIERLQGELNVLTITLEGAHNLLKSPNGERLRTAQGIEDGLNGCFSKLSELEKTLESTLNPKSRRGVMSRFGIHALKWPLKSKDVDDVITTLERYRDTLSTALIIDNK